MALARAVLVDRVMRALALAILVVPVTAAAGPREVTLGVSVGLTRDVAEAGADVEATRALGLWARLRLAPRLSGQLELGSQQLATATCQVCASESAGKVRTGTALLVVDLKDGGRWMPMLIVGAGLDRDDSAFATEAHHFEGGFALEYRGPDGITFGGDLRMGGRSIDSQEDLVQSGPATLRDAGALQAGEYRAARVNLGLRF